jgi:peptide-methionine (S)-S-oxide reductase
LGGGCFWCLDAAFQGHQWRLSVRSGYAGGALREPTYRQVCSGVTGHAEVVQLLFDPRVIDYETLLRVFFTLHDPTTLDRQGADLGTQYRSVIFWHSEAQRATAERVIAKMAAEGLWQDPIVTELAPVPDFYPAEAYHQDYFRQNPNQGYCQVVIAAQAGEAPPTARQPREAGNPRAEGANKAGI